MVATSGITEKRIYLPEAVAADWGAGKSSGAATGGDGIISRVPSPQLRRSRTSGKAFVVYEMSRQVFPTAPSPTMTHLTFCIIDMAPM